MRIVVIGTTGTIGGPLADTLAADHGVVRASRRGAIRVDLADPGSIQALFTTVSSVDGVIDSSDEEYFTGSTVTTLANFRAPSTASISVKYT
jgi:uncharacterized protein YbjT (DUF2867 family)